MRVLELSFFSALNPLGYLPLQQVILKKEVMIKFIEKQSNLRLLLIVLFIAITLRILAAILCIKCHFGMNLIAPDTGTYLARAVDLINNGWHEVVIWHKSGFAQTIYPLILAFLLKYIIGMNYSPDQLIFYHAMINSIWAGLACLCIYYSIMLASNRNKSLSFFTTLTVGTYPEYILWNSYVLKETMGFFAMSLGIYGIYRVINSKHFKTILLNMFLLFLILFINFSFRKTNVQILLPTCALIAIIMIYNWFKKRYFYIYYKRLVFFTIFSTIVISMFFIYGQYRTITSAKSYPLYSFQQLYILNSPGGPFETWGYHERIGKRIPAWQFLEIDKEQYNKDFSHTKKELISIYAMAKYISTSPLDFLTHTSQKFINMWRPVWRNSSIITYLMMGLPYIASIIFFFIHFFRKKRYNFQINILPLLALIIMGATMHLLFVGQIRFRHHILLGVIAIAGISLYEIVFSTKNRYRRNDS